MKQEFYKIEIYVEASNPAGAELKKNVMIGIAKFLKDRDWNSLNDRLYTYRAINTVVDFVSIFFK